MQVDRGLRLGRPFGFPLVVHTVWLPAAALLVAHFAVTVFSPYALPTGVALGLVTAVVTFASVLVHEGAQAAVARRAGLEIERSTIHLVGGQMTFARPPRRPSQVLLVAAAGPVVNGALGVGLLWLGASVGPPLSDVATGLAYMNLAIAAINVVPALPFDGGRLLWGWLWSSGASRYRAMAAAARWGQAASIVAVGAGAWLFWDRPLNAGASAGVLLVVVGVVSWPLAAAGRRAARVTDVVDGRTVGEWRRPFTGRLTIDDRAPRSAGVYAVASDGRLAGVVLGGRRAKGKPVRDAMIPWTPEVSCEEDAALGGALARMSEAGSPVLVVLGRDGVVRGVLHDPDVRAKLGGR